ncbi:MAG: nicotinate phosphoribosyltransferase [Planctomycetota bacterium]
MTATPTDMLDAWWHRHSLALLTDFYQVTMMGGYHSSGKAQQPASFEYFFRSLPPHNGLAVFAGLEPLIDYLTQLRFSDADLEYLDSLGTFDRAFLEALRELRFTGNVWAVREGTPVFPHEPLVRVEAPLIEAQLVESFLLNALNYPTLIATKAARICLAAEGDPVLEFGLRRAAGPDGALSGSRAAYIGGVAATSNVLAGRLFDIPVRGTLAHSWVMSFPDELSSFRAYVKVYPDNPILLVDTYDTVHSGVPNAIRVFDELKVSHPGFRPSIRLDSGDLARLSKVAHAALEEAGYTDPLIVASSDLDEDLIADLRRQGAKINAWGVGTHLITSRDHPALGGVYKLVAIHENGAWAPRIKISSNPVKTTDPGRKQLVRYYGEHNEPLGDVLYAADETPATGKQIRAVDPVRLHLRYVLGPVARHEVLLRPVVKDGQRVVEPERVRDIRDRAQAAVASFPEEYLRLRNPEIFRVMLSPALAKEKGRMLDRDWS